MNIKDFYVSPLGRAKATASCTLHKMNRTATECDWLREFAPTIQRPDVADKRMISWDWLPQDWTKEEEFYRRDLWMQHPVMKEGRVDIEYKWVTDNFDKLLAQYGYVRENDIYHVEKANRDTIVFFCHFGLECVLLSHLMNVSPMLLWHHTAAAPTSVTTIYTEERRKGLQSSVSAASVIYPTYMPTTKSRPSRRASVRPMILSMNVTTDILPNIESGLHVIH